GCFVGIPAQKQPIDEPHDRPKAGLHNQRQRHREDLAAAARPRPPAVGLSGTLLARQRRGGIRLRLAIRFDEHASSPAYRGSDPGPIRDTKSDCWVRALRLYSFRWRLKWKLHLVFHREGACLTTSEASAAIFFLLLAIAPLVIVGQALARSR